MNQFREMAVRRPKLAMGIIFGYTVFNGIWMFPLCLSADISELLLYAANIFIYWVFGVMLLGLYPEKADRSIIAIFLCHGAGLLIRVLLEWGEASMEAALTTMNVAVYMLAVPLLVAVSYQVNKKRLNG